MGQGDGDLGAGEGGQPAALRRVRPDLAGGRAAAQPQRAAPGADHVGDGREAQAAVRVAAAGHSAPKGEPDRGPVVPRAGEAVRVARREAGAHADPDVGHGEADLRPAAGAQVALRERQAGAAAVVDDVLADLGHRDGEAVGREPRVAEARDQEQVGARLDAGDGAVHVRPLAHERHLQQHRVAAAVAPVPSSSSAAGPSTMKSFSMWRRAPQRSSQERTAGSRGRTSPQARPPRYGRREADGEEHEDAVRVGEAHAGAVDRVRHAAETRDPLEQLLGAGLVEPWRDGHDHGVTIPQRPAPPCGD